MRCAAGAGDDCPARSALALAADRRAHGDPNAATDGTGDLRIGRLRLFPGRARRSISTAGERVSPAAPSANRVAPALRRLQVGDRSARRKQGEIPIIVDRMTRFLG